MATTTYGRLADSISRVNLTKYIISLSVEVLAQNVHIIVLVHGYRNLRQLTKTTKANAAQTITLCLEALLSYKVQWVSLVGFSPHKYPPITLSNGRPELIAGNGLAQWPMIVHCPLLNHLDQHTLVLDWCRIKRPFRTGSVIVWKKPPSLSMTILAIFSGDKL